MIKLFSKYDSDILLYGFEVYCREDRELSEPSIARYIAVVKKYITNKFLEKIEIDNYNDFFSKNNLIYIQEEIGSSVKKASISCFLDFLNDENFLENEDYYKLKENIGNSISIERSVNEKQTTFLTPSEVEFLLSEKLVYNTELERILTPLIICLHLFCFYEQKHIKSLTIDDIDLENKRIKNIFYNGKNNVSKYIGMNDIFIKSMTNYIEYRNSINPKTQELILYNGKPIENPGFNKIYNVFGRLGNRERLKSKSIYTDIIIKSMIYHLLIKKGEESLTLILNIIDKDSALFNKVFKEYVEIKINENIEKEIKIEPLNELFRDEKKEKYQDYKETIVNADNSINFNTLLTPYTTDNDINFNDLEVFNIENNYNLQSNKIVIQRLVRDSKIARLLKDHYNHECQLCNYKLRKSDGSYISEAHHLKPYNKKHQGDDTTKNMIVLCPNCHAQFDDQFYAVHPGTLLVHSIFEDDDYHLTNLKLNHELGIDYLEYAWESFNVKKNEIK